MPWRQEQSDRCGTQTSDCRVWIFIAVKLSGELPTGVTRYLRDQGFFLSHAGWAAKGRNSDTSHIRPSRDRASRAKTHNVSTLKNSLQSERSRQTQSNSSIG